MEDDLIEYFLKWKLSWMIPCKYEKEVEQIKKVDRVYLCKYFKCIGACNTCYCEYKYKKDIKWD